MPSGRHRRRRQEPHGRHLPGAKNHHEDLEASVRFIQSSSEDSDDEREDCSSYEEFKKKKLGCTRAEKQLSILVIVCTILLVAMAALIVVNYIMGDSGTCDTPECVTTSAEIIRNMDLSADPCEDFYQYSCGHFTVNNDIPPDKASWTVFASMQEHNYVRIKKLLDGPSDDFHEENSTAIRKAKKYYHACMNTSLPEEEGNHPVIYLLRELGGWSEAPDVLSGRFDPDNWRLYDAMVQAIYHGASPFFSMGVGPDDMDSGTNIISFDQGGLSYSSPKFYKDGNDTDKYHFALVRYIARVMDLMNPTPTDVPEADNEPLIDAEEVWRLEKRLASIMVPEEERLDQRKLYHKMTLREIDGQVGYGMDLADIVNKVYNLIHPDLHLPQSEPVINYSPEYFTKLAKVLMDPQFTNETKADYIAWQLISSVIPYLSLEFRQAQDDFSRELLGVASEDPQWKKCVARTSGAVGFAVGAMFIQDTYTDEEREKVHLLIKRIRETFIARLPSVTWMDDETRSLAVQKAEKVIEKIGYPLDLYESAAKLDEYYEKLNVTDDPFDNMMLARRYNLIRILDRRGQSVDRNEWSMSPETVNAYYNPANNEIVFPAGILQKPFYDTDYPMSWNFGAIGLVMGHELSHGFDNMGRLYDEDGNLKSWWTNKSTTGFAENSQCLEEQYSSYTVAGVNVNGKTTLGENIADNGGLRTSYQAYQGWLGDNGLKDSSYNLPGLHLTNEQLFFVGFAQVWCDYVKPEEAKTLVITDVHSPAKTRVMGTVSNMAEFARAFKCDKGSPMNPEQKCTVW